ncbi:MAG: hypothetical protein AB7G28_00740 [Pirellulales bacterium]
MTMIRPAGLARSLQVAWIVGWFLGGAAAAQEFRNLLSPDLAALPNLYRGSDVDGNTMMRDSRFRNISGTPFVITGVAEIHALDPEDLGFGDMTLANVESVKAAMTALYPHTDLFAWTLWLDGDPPRRTWTTELTLDRAFPILVNPGEEFAYTRVSRNDLFGPNFGPVYAPLPSDQVNAIGEIIIAIDFDWHFVPEPASAWLLICGGLLGRTLNRTRSRGRG